MNFIFLTILFPLIGFFLLSFSQGLWTYNIVTTIGVGSVGLSMVTTFILFIDYFINYHTTVIIHNLWDWITINDFKIPISLSLDGLSLTMLCIITFVGFLVHLYSSWYMRNKEGYSRFFAYTNLFIVNMIILVLADNMLLFYLGWEGVGLCSYLLISFYYTDLNNCISAMKAFIITGFGNILLILSMCFLYSHFKTLNFHNLMLLSSSELIKNSSFMVLITLMLLGGAISKSAQMPLHTWLPNAMVGPTPASALIHSATMVTAGVYLISRTYFLFLLAPIVLYLVSIIGAVTLLFSGLAALIQTDIKQVLAYSTISQLGYMFLALGVKAWYAAIFHLMIHAFFKSLLFLSVGSIIVTNNYEQNIFKLGDKLNYNLLVYISFLFGAASLSSLPLITAGFYSKEAIIKIAFINDYTWLTIIGLIGTFITSLYIFRVFFIVFHSEKYKKIINIFDIKHNLPLIILLILSSFVGSLITLPLFNVLPVNNVIFDSSKLRLLELITILFSIIGMFFSLMYYLNIKSIESISGIHLFKRFFYFVCSFCLFFDFLYIKIFVQPFLIIKEFLFNDPISLLINDVVINLVSKINSYFISNENGQLSWYISSIGWGVIMIILLIKYL